MQLFEILNNKVMKKSLLFMFMFVAALAFFSCQKDDIDNPGDSTTFELKLDKNGMISSPKWLAAKVDSVEHSGKKDVLYPEVLKITTRSDFYIYVTGLPFSSTVSQLYFHKNGKRIYNSDPLMDEIASSTNRETIWSKH